MARTARQPSDVIVVGAGPAGATAALRLARADFTVTLLDGAKFPRPKPCAGWLNVRAADLLKDLGLAPAKFIDHPIDEVTFLSADLAKSARPQSKKPLGLLVDRRDFDQRLAEAAGDLGVHFRESCLVTSIKPLEEGVEVGIRDRQPVRARLLIIAAGLLPQVLRQVGVQTPTDATPTWSAHVEMAKPKPSGGKARTHVTVVLGATPENGFCLAIERPDRVSLTMNTKGDRRICAARLVDFARQLAAKGHVPLDLSKAATSATPLPTFPFSALELESHVGKHTLVIGDAGGFFASASHEGIYPAMWSADIAARVIAQTRDTRFAQDALMRFDSAWRLEMGEFLRPPNTDLQLLLPLIFSNQPMADRMAAAFFGGENI